MHSPSPSPIRLFMPGRLEASRGQQALSAPDWTRRKAQTILARLALDSAHHLLKDQALDLLWPDRSSASVSHNLYCTLPALRQTLNTTLGAGTAYTFELVPANTDARDAAEEILDTLPSESNAWSDKGSSVKTGKRLGSNTASMCG